MTKRIHNTGITLPRITDVSQKPKRVDPCMVADVLGAEPIGHRVGLNNALPKPYPNTNLERKIIGFRNKMERGEPELTNVELLIKPLPPKETPKDKIIPPDHGWKNKPE